jgi:hypothetical protein
MLTSPAGVAASPMRLLEMLTDRFGVFEALFHSTIKLNRCASADESRWTRRSPKPCWSLLTRLSCGTGPREQGRHPQAPRLGRSHSSPLLHHHFRM